MGPVWSGFQQADAAQDQRAHDALAQLGFLHQHIAQPARRHHHGFDLAFGDGIHQRGAVGQLRQLAQEAAGTMRDDGLAAGHRAALAHLDLALEDKGQARGHLARLHDRRRRP